MCVLALHVYDRVRVCINAMCSKKPAAVYTVGYNTSEIEFISHGETSEIKQTNVIILYYVDRHIVIRGCKTCWLLLISHRSIIVIGFVVINACTSQW